MKVRCFAEIPAGLSAVSLVLQGGKHCKPPVSRMGNKHGYSSVILDAMGLRPGQGAQSYLWAEACPDVRSLLAAYTQPALLRAVAEVLRGWKDEEPRALWERLRNERKARKAALPLDQSVAEWMFLHYGSYNRKGIDAGIGTPEGIPEDKYPGFGGVRPTRDIMEAAAERLATGPGWPPVMVTSSAPSAEEVAGWIAMQGMQHPGGGGFAPSVVSPQYGGANSPGRLNRSPWTAEKAADAMNRAALPWPPTCITSRAPTAEEVAGWAWSVRRAHHADIDRGYHSGNETHKISADAPADGFDALAEVSTRPTEPTPGVDLEGCIIYADPPYLGTTPYAHTMDRAEVVRLATSYAAAGALVVVSEAVAIPELTALGWDAVDIAGERRGQRRTFSADGGANEWLTMSRPPAHRPSVQAPLFAMGGR